VKRTSEGVGCWRCSPEAELNDFKKARPKNR
jgi:hypothetical protein